MDIIPRCLNCVHIRKNKEQTPCRQCCDYNKWQRLYSKAEVIDRLNEVTICDDGSPSPPFSREFINSILLHLTEEKGK